MLLLFWSVLGKEIVKRRMIIYIFSLSFSGDCPLSPWKLRNPNLVLEISWPEWACMQHYCLLLGIWLCKTVRDTCFLYLHWTQPCHHWCLDLDSGPATFPVVSSILMFPLPYHSSSYDLVSSPFIHAQTYLLYWVLVVVVLLATKSRPHQESVVSNSATLWAVACQAPLSTGFSRWE